MIPYLSRMAPTRSIPGPSGAAQDRLAGRVLGGRYRVLSRLGEGGMGTVYLCEHAVLGRRYAVKVLRSDLGHDPELVERFRNEAIAASRIGGDNVVDVLDFGAEDDGALYYVMEALAGRSLGALIAEEGPLGVARALALLDQICHALGAAHARGVVHRDVKPDNVFVERRADGAERAKVIDFGISQVAPEAGRERLTRVGEIIGTPEYMAPEQAAGDVVDHRADVYALGVLAYEMLTGTLPILALTPIATLVACQTRAPDPPSHRRPSVPVAVDALVLRALAKRPEDRFASMDAFARAIAAIAGGELSPAEGPAQRSASHRRAPTVALPGARRGFRRGATFGLVAVGLAAVAFVAAAGVSWWRAARARARSTAEASTTTTATAMSNPFTLSVAPPEAGRSRRATATATPTPTHPPRRSAPHPAPSPADAEPQGEHLEDPYAAGALKADPFR